MNTEMKEYIEAVARLNETNDSEEKFEFCRAYYDAKKEDRLTPNQRTYGYEPTCNEDALGLGVPEGFILYDFDEPSDKFREYYKKTWAHTGTKPEGCGHLLFRCKAPHSSMTNDTNLTIFGSEVQLCRKGYRPAYTPGSRKIKGGGITHHWNKIEEILDEPVDFRRERMMAKKMPSIQQNNIGTVVTAAGEIANALGGRKTEGGWIAFCPAHGDVKKPSLRVREGLTRPLLKCYVGCDTRVIIEILKNRGLWDFELTPDEKKACALEIWEESKPAENTLVETYLASRGLNLSMHASIRFHPDLEHSDGGSFPCMVSLITHIENQTPEAIHRTFLAHDGKGRAHIDPAEMALGEYKGCVIRLGEPDKKLILGRSIEKCLLAMQEKGLPAWAHLHSSSATIKPPPSVKEVFVLNGYDNKNNPWAKRNLKRQAAKQGFRITFEDEMDIDPEKIKVRRS